MTKGQSKMPSLRLPQGLLFIFCLLPAVQTLVSVYWQWHTPVTYPTLKSVMILIPILVWHHWRRLGISVRERLGWTRPSLKGSLGMGVLMSGLILGAYFIFLRDSLDPSPIIGKVASLKLTDYYWTMAIVISLWNSLFEEYYWRAFIISELHSYLSSRSLVCLLGGFLFGLHHILALLHLFDWPIVAICTLGTMAAGAMWSWMRLRGLSIWDCYFSHIAADLSVMWIGYDLIVRGG